MTVVFYLCPLMEDKRLMEASWWERLTVGETGSCSDGHAVLSKCLIQFSVDGWGCIPSLLFTWTQTVVEVMKIMVTSFRRPHACTPCIQCPQPCSRPPRTHASAGDSQTPTGKSRAVSLLLWGHCSFLLRPGAQVSVVPSENLFPSPV